MSKGVGIPLSVKIVGLTTILVIAVLTVIITLTAIDTKEHVFELQEHNLEIMTDLAEDLISAEIKGLNYQNLLFSENEHLIEDIIDEHEEDLRSFVELNFKASE